MRRADIECLDNAIGLLDNKSIIASSDRRLEVAESVRSILEYVRERKARKGVSVKCELLQRLDKALANARDTGRLKEYRMRLMCEVAEAVEQGRFIVFNSLTVDERYYRKVFCEGSNCWRIAMQRWRRRVEFQAKLNEEEAYYSYFGVVEEGGTTGRLHFHTVQVMSHLPAGCADPNPQRLGTNRIVEKLREFWPYGYSAPVAVRYSGDAYGQKLNWHWPAKIEEKDGKPVLQPLKSSALALARYMTKYLLKQGS